MENVRKFTIVDTDTQQIKVIESAANTLGELKADLTRNGFNVEDKAIQEGLTKTEFMSDDAILPRDVVRNGNVTNDLVFRITNVNKKIKSGAVSGERASLYSYIKDNHLEEAVRELFNKSYTNIPTATLRAFVEDHKNCCCEESCGTNPLDEKLVENIKLAYEEVVSKMKVLTDILSANNLLSPKNDSPYTNEELKEMFDF